MDSTLLGLLIGTVLAVAGSGLFSGCEMGIYSLNTMRLRLRSERGDRAARRLLPFMDRYETLVSSTLIGTNICDYLASAFVSAALLHMAVAAEYAELYTTAIVTPLLLVFGNIVPKERFRVATDTWMYGASWMLTNWTRVTQWTGLPAALAWLSRTLLRSIDPERADAERDLLPRARMVRALREGVERGGLSELQRETFERVMALSRVRLARVMVPLARAATIAEDISRADFLRIARMAHFARLPVYRGDPHNIIGVVSVFDVLTDETDQPVRAHMSDVLRLRPQDTVPRAMGRLQRGHESMAVVVDRHGHALGVLTMKDLVEEIVGELDAW